MSGKASSTSGRQQKQTQHAHGADKASLHRLSRVRSSLSTSAAVSSSSQESRGRTVNRQLSYEVQGEGASSLSPRSRSRDHSSSSDRSSTNSVGTSRTYTSSNHNLAQLLYFQQRIGDQVVIGGEKTGKLRYVGGVHVAPRGIFCGVELDDKDGKHDGSVDGQRYFECGARCGIFAPIDKVDFVSEKDQPFPEPTSSQLLSSMSHNPRGATAKLNKTFNNSAVASGGSGSMIKPPKQRLTYDSQGLQRLKKTSTFVLEEPTLNQTFNCSSPVAVGSNVCPFMTQSCIDEACADIERASGRDQTFTSSATSRMATSVNDATMMLPSGSFNADVINNGARQHEADDMDILSSSFAGLSDSTLQCHDKLLMMNSFVSSTPVSGGRRRSTELLTESTFSTMSGIDDVAPPDDLMSSFIANCFTGDEDAMALSSNLGESSVFLQGSQLYDRSLDGALSLSSSYTISRDDKTPVVDEDSGKAAFEAAKSRTFVSDTDAFNHPHAIPSDSESTYLSLVAERSTTSSIHDRSLPEEIGLNQTFTTNDFSCSESATDYETVTCETVIKNSAGKVINVVREEQRIKMNRCGTPVVLSVSRSDIRGSASEDHSVNSSFSPSCGSAQQESVSTFSNTSPTTVNSSAPAQDNRNGVPTSLNNNMNVGGHKVSSSGSGSSRAIGNSRPSGKDASTTNNYNKGIKGSSKRTGARVRDASFTKSENETDTENGQLSPQNSSSYRPASRPAKKSRHEDIMSQLQESMKRDKAKPKTVDVKSKVMTQLDKDNNKEQSAASSASISPVYTEQVVSRAATSETGAVVQNDEVCLSKQPLQTTRESTSIISSSTVSATETNNQMPSVSGVTRPSMGTSIQPRTKVSVPKASSTVGPAMKENKAPGITTTTNASNGISKQVASASAVANKQSKQLQQKRLVTPRKITTAASAASKDSTLPASRFAPKTTSHTASLGQSSTLLAAHSVQNTAAHHQRTAVTVATAVNKTKATATASSSGAIPAPRTNQIEAPQATAIVSHLEQKLREKTAQLNLVTGLLKERTVGFEAMLALVKYLTGDLNAFAMPAVVGNFLRTQNELDTVKNLHDVVTKDRASLESELHKLTEQHVAELENLRTEHAAAVETLSASLKAEFSQAKQQILRQHQDALVKESQKHREEVEKLTAGFANQKQQLDTERSSELKQLSEKHGKEIQALKDSFEVERCNHEAGFALTMKNLEGKLYELQMQRDKYKREAADLQQTLLRDTDSKVQLALAKFKDLPQEIESLKVVLEMRNEEVQKFRVQTSEYKQQIEDIQSLKEKLRTLEAKNEDLKEMISMKIRAEKALGQEHRHLQESLEKESKQKQRLAMQNEELRYKLSESMSFSTPGPSQGHRFTSGTESDSDGIAQQSQSCYASLPSSVSPLARSYSSQSQGSPRRTPRDMPVTIYTPQRVFSEFDVEVSPYSADRMDRSCGTFPRTKAADALCSRRRVSSEGLGLAANNSSSGGSNNSTMCDLAATLVMIPPASPQTKGPRPTRSVDKIGSPKRRPPTHRAVGKLNQLSMSATGASACELEDVPENDATAPASVLPNTQRLTDSGIATSCYVSDADDMAKSTQSFEDDNIEGHEGDTELSDTDNILHHSVNNVSSHNATSQGTNNAEETAQRQQQFKSRLPQLKNNTSSSFGSMEQSVDKETL